MIIDTVSNAVAGLPIMVGVNPTGVAITPDGKRAYVTNQGSNNVSVIDTASNTVVGIPITVGTGPAAVGIMPPPAGVPFSAFSASLGISCGGASNSNGFDFLFNFTLGSASNGINPVTEPVTLKLNTFALTIPPVPSRGKGLGHSHSKGKSIGWV